MVWERIPSGYGIGRPAATAVLPRAEAVDETDRNMFLGNWLPLAAQDSTNNLKPDRHRKPGASNGCRRAFRTALPARQTKSNKLQCVRCRSARRGR